MNPGAVVLIVLGLLGIICSGADIDPFPKRTEFFTRIFLETAVKSFMTLATVFMIGSAESGESRWSLTKHGRTVRACREERL